MNKSVRRSILGVFLIATPGVVTAAATASCFTPRAREGLDHALYTFNEGIRWKRFAQASQFLPEEQQAEFLRRYLGSENDLHIESLEVRAVTSRDDGQGGRIFEVTVAAEAYVLPSTVLEKKIITERWQEKGGSWELIGCEPELLPGAALGRDATKSEAELDVPRR